jgi:phosphatidylserine/phosphatidylglycerophosphate/cardiolipin synthase-like enzyme
MYSRFTVIILTLFGLALSPVHAKQTPDTVVTTIESGFSPDGSAHQLVINAINSAQKSLRLAAYAFTSPTVVDALIKAKRRGVDIAVIVDYRQNIQLDNKGRGKAALNLLVNAKIPVRTLNSKNTQHSKYMVIDGLHVQTGSFNYSAAAARYNHENVILIRNNAALAEKYSANWQTLYDAGVKYTSNY